MMKRSRFTEGQIIAALREQEVGLSTRGLPQALGCRLSSYPPTR